MTHALILGCTLILLARTAPAPAPAPADRVDLADLADLGDLADPSRLQALFGGGPGLTAAEVAKRATDHSPEVTARQARVRAADAETDATLAPFWPRVQGEARYLRLSPLEQTLLPGFLVPLAPSDRTPGPLRPDAPLLVAAPTDLPSFENQFALTATVSLPVSDYLLRLSRTLSAGQRGLRAARWEAQAARRKVAADARIAYYDWARACGQVLVLDDRLRVATEQVRELQRLFEVGIVSRADVLRSQTQSKTVALALVRARNAAGLAEQALRVAMRDGSRAEYRIGENLLAPPAPVRGFGDELALRAEAIGSRPELAALAEAEQALLQQEALARVGRLPRLDVMGTVQQANPNQRLFPPRQRWDRTWQVGVVLSWVLSDIPGAYATADLQAARADETRARRGQLLDQIRLELHQARSAISEAEAALDSGQQALESAAEGYRVRLELFRAGKTTLVELLDAEAELTRSRLETINARVEARIARVRFDYAVGREP